MLEAERPAAPAPAPVLSLPNELTTEIFFHFLPTYPDCPPLTGLASPTTLTHVCHRWRQIGLTTPALWRAIKFTENLVPSSDRIHSIFDAWIDRSASFPLSLDIAIADRDLVAQILKDPSPLGGRALALGVPEALCTPATPNPNPNKPQRFFLKPEFWAERVPNLRAVVLHGEAIVRVTVPWAALTCVTLNRVTVHDCMHIVVRARRRLVRCVLNFDGDDELVDEDRADAEKGILLPWLESLVVTEEESMEWSMAAAGGFKFNLESFVAPSLRRLEVQEEFLKPDPVASLKAFISKSGCALREVCIIGNTTPELESYRRAFPSISTFSFSART
ncbi:F-box domain-containing protein [Mycena sanguinolenta]|uniref:F-box domain-containing protein n=1 Tax=Mycena sanguinolenta TaxID=230812 RepID=A0A8H6ZFT5_9AGAR|nr:F-box domain-containing protein [Mycena sanguinolenta]